MTKSDHQQKAQQLAWQVGHCYSKTAKRRIVSECLMHLRESLKG
jgi:hypothetical protein